MPRIRRLRVFLEHFVHGICQSCNAPWQFDKRSPQRDGRPSGKGGGSGAGQDNVPAKAQRNGDPKPGAKTPTSTRWGNWDWSWDSAPVEETEGPAVIDEAKQLVLDIATMEKDIAQLLALLGKEHEEVTDHQAKLEVLQAR